MHNRRVTDGLSRIPTEWTCSFNGLQLTHRTSRAADRVLQQAVRRPGKRSLLLAHSRGCLHRQPERLMMIIASHRLVSTWSRPSSTERRRRWWVTERALLKARLEIGTDCELFRPSGHVAVLAGPGGDRWAARSGAVPAAILQFLGVIGLNKIKIKRTTTLLKSHTRFYRSSICGEYYGMHKNEGAR